MTAIQPVLLDKLNVILHRAFVEARNLALAQRCPQLVDLADTFEILPILARTWQEDTLNEVRSILQNYQNKYQGLSYDYLSILEMDDEAFRKRYDQDSLALDPNWIGS